MRKMMSVICAHVKKIVLASETKMVQKRRFRTGFFWPIFLIYANFKAEFPSLKIGSSTFALLQPKWCMPVGTAGSHNVCLSTCHQNVKLVLNTVNTFLNYKDVLKLCVCSTE